MFSGPMFRWEYQTALRKQRPFFPRMFFALFLNGAALLVGLIVFTAQSSESGELVKLARVTMFGRVAFSVTVAIQLVLLLFVVSASVGSAIAEEREKDTLSQLLLTRLTPIEIVLTKMVARWSSATNIIYTGLPVLVATAVLGGLIGGFQSGLVLTVLVLFTTSLFVAALAILASARSEKAGTACAKAMGWSFGWLLGPPIMAIIPTVTGSLWGDLFAELRELCRLIAPSSPLSLVTDSSWLARAPAIRLEERVAWMIGLQALFGLVALVFAASQLKARETNPNWTDPTRGYRPPCGDDPIYWREYEMPMRRGAGSLLLIRLRYVIILIRALVLNYVTLLFTLLLLAIPVGLLIATFQLGIAAFAEVWRQGYGLSGPHEAREQFNLLIQIVTGLLAFFPAMSLGSNVTSKITIERDRKTWDILLTTPLSGREIIRSKVRAAVESFWRIAWPVPILWILGLLCGSTKPLGVVLAAVDLIVFFWAAVILGLYWGLRPGTTSSIATWSAIKSLGYMIFYAPALWASLISPQQFATFTTWDYRLRWGLITIVLLIPILTGVAAWHLTRQLLDRFDEWVGRPCRPKTPTLQASQVPSVASKAQGAFDV